MDYRDYVVQDERYMRPEELKYLRGDSEDIRNKLGWKPKYNFETMIDEMIQVWEERL
jgi:GDPmannose 4,6-dehydratase